MTYDDICELYKLYYEAVTSGKIKDLDGNINRMAASLEIAQKQNQPERD